MKLFEMETPCLVLEKGRLQRNIERMRTQVGQLGAKLRPHLKTAKSIEVARMALANQSGGITVSTLKEADYFFEHGITDLLYAVGIALIKLDHVAELTKRGATLTIILDSLEQAQAAVRKAQTHGVTLPVMIEIDSDGHRSGVTPDDPLLVEIGRMVHGSQGLHLKGVLTHAGDSYGCKRIAEIRRFSVMEREGAVRCSENLRQAGLPCPTVSVGSTPTATYAMDYAGVTEVRAGVYMFSDLKMAGLDVCSIDDLALSVAASVIGHQRQKGWVITDAGWMALSSDRGTAKQKIDQGFGVVCDIKGRPYPDLIVVGANQEHGIIAKRPGLGRELEWHSSRSAAWFAFFPIMPARRGQCTIVTTSSMERPRSFVSGIELMVIDHLYEIKPAHNLTAPQSCVPGPKSVTPAGADVPWSLLTTLRYWQR